MIGGIFDSRFSIFDLKKARALRGRIPARSAEGGMTPIRKSRIENRKFPNAFTLLEVLVAVTLLTLLVVMLMGVVDNAIKLWRTSENRVESYREARAALNLIANDLKSIYASTNAALFQTNALPGFEAVAGDGQIFFIATLPAGAQDTNSRSDLCEVGYFLRYGRSGLSAARENTLSLYRYFRESNQTFTNLANNSGCFHFDPANVELLARNIPRFAVNYYSLDANGDLVPWSATSTHPVPGLVELQITAFNSQTAKRLNSQADWQNTNSRLYHENSRTFTARIPIRSPQ